ncbi:MAG: chemotaxis protein CheW [Acidimicrobiales bacterium]
MEVRTSAGDQRNGTATDDGVRSVLLAAIGRHHIAIDVQVIHNVLPELALERSILDGPACLGTTPLLQSRIPVADPLAVLRLGDLADTAVHRGIALRHERGFVAFALSDVHQIRRIALQELGPLPPIGLARPELFQGLWHGADGPPYLLVDGDRLLADPDVTAMAALNTGRPDGAVEARTDDAARLDDEAGRARAGRRYVACSIGIDVAVPIEQIDEITTFPDRLITEATSEEVIGVFLHRGLAVPLVRLAPVVGVHRPADNDADRRVIVVRHRGHTVGFVVDRLLAIARSVWEEADGAGSGHTIGTLAAGSPLVRLDATEVHGLIAHLDLPAVVDAVLAADALAADPLLGEAA